MKVRRRIELKNEAGELVASGVLYTEGNVQILWRQDIGDTGEQFNGIANLIGLCGAVSIHVDPCPDVKQDQIPLIPVGKPNVNTKIGAGLKASTEFAASVAKTQETIIDKLEETIADATMAKIIAGKGE